MERNFYRETAERIEKALKFCDDTKAVVIGESTLTRAGEFFKKLFSNARAIVVADATTYRIAGRQANEALRASGVETDEPYIFDEPHMHAEMRLVDMLKPR